MAKNKYDYNDGFQLPVSAQKAGEALDKLRIEKDGAITRKDLVEAAKKRNHPLHKCFEWNDKAAANKHRIERAGYIMRAVTVRFLESKRKNEGPIRFLVSTMVNNQRSYISMHDAMADPITREELVASALDQLEAWTRRWKRYDELADICDKLSKPVKLLRTAQKKKKTPTRTRAKAASRKMQPKKKKTTRRKTTTRR